MKTPQPNIEHEPKDDNKQSNYLNKDTNFESKTFERLREVIELNHTLATKMSSIEKLYDQTDELDLDDPKLNDILSSVPYSYRDLFENVIEVFKRSKKKARMQHKRLKELVEKYRSIGEEGENMTGKLIFQSLTDKEPVSEVEYSQQAGYHLLTFESRKDYNTAKSGERVSEGQHVHREYVGVFKSADSYGASAYATLLLVAPQRSEEDMEATAIHERQHYINHSLFGRFLKTEGRAGREDSEEIEEHEKFWELKDELLAQLRNKTFHFADSLDPDGFYSNLFKNLSEEDIGKATETIQNVQEFTNKYHEFLDTPEKRATFIYQLTMIPFEGITKWLDAIDQYYEKRVSYLKKFDIEVVKTVSGLDSTPKRKLKSVVNGVYDTDTNRKLEENKSELEDNLEGLESIQSDARDVLRDITLPLDDVEQEIKPMLTKYQEKRRKIVEAVSAVQPKEHGKIKPFVHDTYVYDTEYFEIDNLQSAEKTNVSKIRQNILQELNDLSEKDVTKLYKEEDASLEQSIRSQIKEVIDSHDNSFDVNVYIDSDTEALPDAVDIYIKLSRENPEKRVKGMEISTCLPPYNLEDLK